MNYTKISKEELLAWLKDNLNDERYEHSIGTAEMAAKLAKEYSQDEQRAYFAGLLHDCAKCFPVEKLLKIIDDKKLDVDPIEKMNYKTLHAPVSAYVAKTEFGVDDEEILSAIRWHTIGKIEMTDFEKIIYLADKIELRTREAEYADPIRECLVGTNGLDKAMLQSYKLTIKSLVDRNLKICPMTIDIYNHLEDVLNVK